jgi:vitamin K-dependent gamma-carboxylase
MTLSDRLSRPVSGSSAAIFRIAVGSVGVLFVLRFFAHGWIEQLYISPAYHFAYPGFEWVRAWPGIGMYIHFALLGLTALGVALGYRYRICAAAFTLLLAYVELIDRSLYLNHYYWLVLTGALISFLPLNRVWSLDSRAGRTGPGLVPEGVVWLLRFQVGMVYFFAGLAKVTADWLLEAQPLTTWLQARSDLLAVGPILASRPAALLASWAAAIFDLTVVGWLLWKPSRPYAFAALVGFHTMTWILFPMIGLFPLLMTLAALIFFEPEWPENLTGRAVVDRKPAAGSQRTSPILRRVASVGIAVYLAAMLLIPLRHLHCRATSTPPGWAIWARGMSWLPRKWVRSASSSSTRRREISGRPTYPTI